MNSNNLISIIKNKSRYSQTIPYLLQIKKSNQDISKLSIQVIKDILSKNQYKAKDKLFAMRFLKDCFEQADTYFMREVETQILPLLAKIIRDSDQSQSFATYSEKQYQSESQLRSFKSELFSMFIFCQECIKNWALWMMMVKRKQNPYMVLKSSLEAQRINFPIENKYFQEKNRQQFITNYQYHQNGGYKQEISNQNQVIFAPAYSQKQSKYSKKLDLILGELSQLNQRPYSQEQKRREIDRISNMFEQVIESYMSSAEQFDQRFVNDYYSRLETIIKQIQQKQHKSFINQNVEEIKYHPQNIPKQDSSLNDPYGMKINHPPQLARQLNLAFPSSNQSQPFSKQSSALSNISKNSSVHPPIRIPSLDTYPTSQILTNNHIQNSPKNSQYKPSTPYLPENVQQIKYQPLQQQQLNNKKNVVINQNMNQIKQYYNSIDNRQPSHINNIQYYPNPQSNTSNYNQYQIHPKTPQIIKYTLPIQPTVPIPKPPSSQSLKKQYIRQTPHPSTSTPQQPNITTIPQAPSHSMINSPRNNTNITNISSLSPKQQILYQLNNPQNAVRTQNQNILAQKLLRQRRQNFHLSQHLLSLQLKVESLSKQMQQKQKDQQAKRLFYKSNSNSNFINTPSLSNLLQRAKSSTIISKVDANFFKQEQLVHALEIKLKNILGWTNINKFKLSVLGATSILFKDSKIKVNSVSKQIFNKGILCIELMLKIKTKSKHQSIEVKYKNNREYDLWTKPFQHNSSDEVHQQIICTVVDTPLPITQGNVLLDGIGTKIVLPILLINFLVNGDVSPDKFRNAFITEQRYIIKSKIIQLNPVTVPKQSIFSKYFICSYKDTQTNIIRSGLLYPYKQILLLLQIEILSNQRALFRVLQVGAKQKALLAKQFLDNLIFLFSA